MKPACMDRCEYAAWKASGGRSVPCYDCTSEYAGEMQDIGQCRILIGDAYVDGTPGISPWTNPKTRRQYNAIKAREYRRRMKAVA